MIGIGFTDSPMTLELPRESRLVTMAPNVLQAGEWVYVYETGRAYVYERIWAYRRHKP